MFHVQDKQSGRDETPSPDGSENPPACFEVGDCSVQREKLQKKLTQKKSILLKFEKSREHHASPADEFLRSCWNVSHPSLSHKKASMGNRSKASLLKVAASLNRK
jgi:hypothetical protein